jgi:hypothetical protein
MARKNPLREVKALGSSSTKSQKEDIFAYSDEWEVWEQVGENPKNPNDWSFLTDGSLSDCEQAIMFFLTFELEGETEDETEDEISDEGNIEDFFEQKAKQRSQKLEVVKKACLTNGEYKGDGWTIRSQRTREQCEWLAQNGVPGL